MKIYHLTIEERVKIAKSYYKNVVSNVATFCTSGLDYRNWSADIEKLCFARLRLTIATVSEDGNLSRNVSRRSGIPGFL